MSNPRTPIDELEFFRSPNVARARKRQEEEANRLPLAKQAEIEELFEELKIRRRESLADVKKNGAVITQEKSNSRGMIYLIRIVNPALKVAQDCERQLTQLAKLLGTAKPKRGESVEDLLKRADALTEN